MPTSVMSYEIFDKAVLESRTYNKSDIFLWPVFISTTIDPQMCSQRCGRTKGQRVWLSENDLANEFCAFQSAPW